MLLAYPYKKFFIRALISKILVKQHFIKYVLAFFAASDGALVDLPGLQALAEMSPRLVSSMLDALWPSAPKT